MKHIALIVCAAAAALLAGCMLFPMEGSGVLVTSRYAFSGFSKITTDQACQLRVIPDSAFGVTVTCDDNLLPYLVVETSGPDGVVIGLRQGYSFNRITFTAEVHVPTLTALVLSGASQAVVAPGFSSGQALSLGIFGASRADIAGMTCGALAADVSGASTLTFVGGASSETVSVSGASTADLLGCVSPRAAVVLSGASQCSVDVGSGPVTVAASGASTLFYRGAPSVSVQELSGGSRIVKLN
jgi:hypothetical protein